MAHSLLSAIKGLGLAPSNDAGTKEKQQLLTRRSEVSVSLQCLLANI